MSNYSVRTCMGHTISVGIVEVASGPDFVEIEVSNPEGDGQWLRLNRREFETFQLIMGTVGADLLDRHWDKNSLQNMIQATNQPQATETGSKHDFE